MGIALGDYNRDGKLDLFVTTFSDDNKTLYRNDGDAAFTDVSFRAGLGMTTIPFLIGAPASSISTMTVCYDLFLANGHVYPITDQTDWGLLTPSARYFFAISTARNSRRSPPPRVAASPPSFAPRGCGLRRPFQRWPYRRSSEQSRLAAHPPPQRNKVR